MKKPASPERRNREYAICVTAQTAGEKSKSSTTTRHVVVDALPLLVGARDVLIATVRDAELAPRENVADVKLFLGRQGAKARSEILDRRLGEASEAALQLASTIAADLVVLGRYGYSRVQEAHDKPSMASGSSTG